MSSTVASVSEHEILDAEKPDRPRVRHRLAERVQSPPCSPPALPRQAQAMADCLAIAIGALALTVIVTTVGAGWLVQRSFPQTSGELALPRSGRRGRGRCATSSAFRRSWRTPATTSSMRRDSCTRRTGSGRWTCAGTSPPGGCQRCSGRRRSRPTSSSARWGGVGSPRKSSTLLSDETLDALQAYADGVNAYLADRTATEVSLEYAALRLTARDYEIESWTPADSVSWLKAMAWDLRANIEEETGRALLGAQHRRPGQRPLPAVPLRPAPADRH